MKKLSVLVALLAILGIKNVKAGEYLPYVGVDYVNSTLNLKGDFDNKFADNYNVPTINAGIKFVDYGAIEFFAQRALKEKKVMGSNVSRSKFYGYGADVLMNAYTLSEGALLASVGYGRFSSNMKYNGASNKDSTNALRLGFGSEINPTPEWGFRAMFRYTFANSDNYNRAKEFSVGARYYFE